jgi:transposase
VNTAYSKDDGTITAEHVISYFEKLLLYYKSRGISKTMVIMDNAKIHTSEEMKQFAIAHENDLVLLRQPPYSPELNPQENMWNLLKKFISKASAAINEQEIKDAVEKLRHISRLILKK